MSSSYDSLTQKLSDMRAAFDESFAAPAALPDVAYEDMLAIEVGGHPFAVRIAELAGVHPFRRVTPLPERLPGLLGVIGVRGRLVAAYRLADLLGLEGHDGRLRWLLVTGGVNPIGLAIEGLNSYIQVALSSLYPAPSGETLGQHIREASLQEGVTRGVLSIPSISAAIMRAARPVSQVKES